MFLAKNPSLAPFWSFLRSLWPQKMTFFGQKASRDRVFGIFWVKKWPIFWPFKKRPKNRAVLRRRFFFRFLEKWSFFDHFFPYRDFKNSKKIGLFIVGICPRKVPFFRPKTPKPLFLGFFPYSDTKNPKKGGEAGLACCSGPARRAP